MICIVFVRTRIVRMAAWEWASWVWPCENGHPENGTVRMGILRMAVRECAFWEWQCGTRKVEIKILVYILSLWFGIRLPCAPACMNFNIYSIMTCFYILYVFWNIIVISTGIRKLIATAWIFYCELFAQFLIAYQKISDSIRIEIWINISSVVHYFGKQSFIYCEFTDAAERSIHTYIDFSEARE